MTIYLAFTFSYKHNLAYEMKLIIEYAAVGVVPESLALVVWTNSY